MSSPFVDLLGDSLLGKDGAKLSTADALAGKTAVGLYFSAHWCPPCRGFTPMLGAAYTKDLKAKGLEIVFVSSDKDEDQFTSYFNEQPWLALPYDQRSVKAALSKKYKVQGIPTFVVLDGATGEVITADGREAVSEDPTGKSFPWRPPSFWEALGTDFLQGMDGDTVDVDDLKGEGKVIGLYFSAHWCPPCRGFTPKLVEAYTKHLKAKGLEIIFVSSDRDQKSFQEYYSEMPWLAIPNGDPRKAKLSQRFGVSGIPALAFVDANTGETINGNARGAVSSDPEGLTFPYWPAALNSLEEPEGINEEAALCVFLDGCDEATAKAAKGVLEPIAKASKAAKEDMLFFYSTAGGQIASRVRDMVKLGKPSEEPKMVLLDIPDEGGYYVSDATVVTPDTVKAFLDAYKAKALERKQLQA